MSLDISDADVAEAFAEAVGYPGKRLRVWVPKYKRTRSDEPAKTMYSFHLHGQPALALLQAMWPLLSTRRRAQITEIVEKRRRMLNPTRPDRVNASYAENTTSRYGEADLCYQPYSAAEPLGVGLNSPAPLPAMARIPVRRPTLGRHNPKKRRKEGLEMRARQSASLTDTPEAHSRPLAASRSDARGADAPLVPNP